MQDSINKGYSKFVYNDLGSDVKCVDVISAIDTIKDLYQKEKEKNEEYEKTILQDTSYSMITRLEMKLKYDIEQINKKLTSDVCINDYRIARLKGIRTKCKELLELLEERN